MRKILRLSELPAPVYIAAKLVNLLIHIFERFYGFRLSSLISTLVIFLYMTSTLIYTSYFR